eukprot:SAG11_NODE_6666_length_1271_cov_1.078498_1_plen_279_part_00
MALAALLCVWWWFGSGGQTPAEPLQPLPAGTVALGASADAISPRSVGKFGSNGAAIQAASELAAQTVETVAIDRAANSIELRQQILGTRPTSGEGGLPQDIVAEEVQEVVQKMEQDVQAELKEEIKEAEQEIEQDLTRAVGSIKEMVLTWALLGGFLFVVWRNSRRERDGGAPWRRKVDSGYGDIEGGADNRLRGATPGHQSEIFSLHSDTIVKARPLTDEDQQALEVGLLLLQETAAAKAMREATKRAARDAFRSFQPCTTANAASSESSPGRMSLR